MCSRLVLSCLLLCVGSRASCSTCVLNVCSCALALQKLSCILLCMCVRSTCSRVSCHAWSHVHAAVHVLSCILLRGKANDFTGRTLRNAFGNKTCPYVIVQHQVAPSHKVAVTLRPLPARGGLCFIVARPDTSPPARWVSGIRSREENRLLPLASKSRLSWPHGPNGGGSSQPGSPISRRPNSKCNSGSFEKQLSWRVHVLRGETMPYILQHLGIRISS